MYIVKVINDYNEWTRVLKINYLSCCGYNIYSNGGIPNSSSVQFSAFSSPNGPNNSSQSEKRCQKFHHQNVVISTMVNLSILGIGGFCLYRYLCSTKKILSEQCLQKHRNYYYLRKLCFHVFCIVLLIYINLLLPATCPSFLVI